MTTQAQQRAAHDFTTSPIDGLPSLNDSLLFGDSAVEEASNEPSGSHGFVSFDRLLEVDRWETSRTSRESERTIHSSTMIHEHIVEEPYPQIPSESKPLAKKLILCFDGTMDQFDGDNSNVVQFFSLLDKDDTSQKLYYQAGIGTYLGPQVLTPTTKKLVKMVDAAIGFNLKTHIMNGYEFVMQNYMHFGFSRGAYTARALAGMLLAVGLLPKDNYQQVPFAYTIYREGSDNKLDPNFARCMLFKETYSRHVEVEFLGLWDTVLSIGLSNERLPFTTFNPLVKKVRHALALDERRVKFAPSTWHRGLQKSATKDSEDKQKRVSYRWRGRTRSKNDDLLVKELSVSKYYGTGYDDVEEVWFAGCHCDVGGGAVPNDTVNSLARIPLRWMVKQCIQAELGFTWNPDKLSDIGLFALAQVPPNSIKRHPIPLPRSTRTVSSPPPYFEDDEKSEWASDGNGSSPKRNSSLVRRMTTSIGRRLSQIVQPRPDIPRKATTGPKTRFSSQSTAGNRGSGGGNGPMNEKKVEERDAKSPKFCQLKLSKLWWMLEFLPVKIPYQTEKGVWKSRQRPHMGAPREFPVLRNGEKTKIHHTVKVRIEKTPPFTKPYRPKTRACTQLADEHLSAKGVWERFRVDLPNIEWVQDPDVQLHHHRH